MRTNVYIDGFNLYYGIKDTPYKWLDISKLCQLLLPKSHMKRIRYFTARVQARPGDPQKPQRQDMFIRALQTIPNLTVHYGHYLTHTVRMPLASPPSGGPNTVEVIRTEEKGSDVNLATYLLVDGFDRDYELAVVISNDSDLVEPIRVVKEKLGLQVGVLNPQPRTTSWALVNTASFYRYIRQGVLQASQFPPTLQDATGVLTRPAAW